MFILDSLFVGGLRFVLETVAEVADREQHDPARWRDRLLAAQLAHENGEISAQELAVCERDILARMRELQPDTEKGVVLSSRDVSRVEVSADIGESGTRRR